MDRAAQRASSQPLSFSLLRSSISTSLCHKVPRVKSLYNPTPGGKSSSKTGSPAPRILQSTACGNVIVVLRWIHDQGRSICNTFAVSCSDITGEWTFLDQRYQD
ncbi:hypothetical protein BDW42DRAFT_177816 [Aspergillus taichungensis]|uniref:Uncharacterized protein n=1 Tax=Aspergillus taichungensis TaxID=482145 RepID=A0A2J5HIN3_9EURO|nr:hypothetical protein BDW42DRAFT_177816 [Aspergillus taichungensis]